MHLRVQFPHNFVRIARPRASLSRLRVPPASALRPIDNWMTNRWLTVELRSPGRQGDWRAWYRRVRRVPTAQARSTSPSATALTAAEDRMIAQLRGVIAAAVMLVVAIDPSHVHGPATLTYSALAAFGLYSVLMYAAATGRLQRLQGLLAWNHWVDLGWITLVVGLTGAAHSIFFVGYFFAILNASFRSGFRAGAFVTLGAFLLFLALGYLWTPHGPPELGRALVRPMYLLGLGYLIAYWGEFHVSLTERLRLLKEVNALSNPRFGVDRTIANVLQRLRTFYRADACVLVTPSPAGDSALVWRCDGRPHAAGNAPTELPAAAVGALLALETRGAAAGAASGSRRSDGSLAGGGDEARLQAIAEALSAVSFMTVPWPSHGGGRLYVASHHRRAFEPLDLELLEQVVAQVILTLENVRLVDRLATDAAEAERLRIARDLHDTVVQPYIGIRMGLAGIRQKLRSNQDVSHDLDLLSDVIALEIEDLRGYLRELKAQGTSRGALGDALARFAERFGDATGIDVSLEIAGSSSLNDRLAAEAFQMVAEAVSNVRRHTESRTIDITVRADPQTLVIHVDNDGVPSEPPQAFVPKSIGERAAALGGGVTVEHRSGGSRVTIWIPL